MAQVLAGLAVIAGVVLLLHRLLAALPSGPDDQRMPLPMTWDGGWDSEPVALAEVASRLAARGVPVRGVQPTTAFGTFVVRFADGTDLLVTAPRRAVGALRLAARLQPISAARTGAGALTLTWPGGGTPVTLRAASAPVTVRR